MPMTSSVNGQSSPVPPFSTSQASASTAGISVSLAHPPAPEVTSSTAGTIQIQLQQPSVQQPHTVEPSTTSQPQAQTTAARATPIVIAQQQQLLQQHRPASQAAAPTPNQSSAAVTVPSPAIASMAGLPVGLMMPGGVVTSSMAAVVAAQAHLAQAQAQAQQQHGSVQSHGSIPQHAIQSLNGLQNHPLLQLPIHQPGAPGQARAGAPTMGNNLLLQTLPPSMMLPGMALPPHPAPSAQARTQPQTATLKAEPEAKRSEIYRYTSPKPLYAAAWSHRKSEKFRLAVASLVEREQMNRVSIIQLDEVTGSLVERCSFPHEFPANCVRFIPDMEGHYPDLIATSCDALRIHRITGDGLVRPEELVLTSNKSQQYTAPLTSFDWSEVDPRLIGTASIDTTCTIFDIEYGRALGYAQASPVGFGVKTQLIAHDKPVHDIAFSKMHHGKDHFATVGADGSARMFDLRNLEHSTIVYEDPMKNPLMHLAWNKNDPCYLATFSQDSTEVVIIDIRMPCNPITKLKNHTAAVNGLAWAPHSHIHICTAGDDAQALIWDLNSQPGNGRPVEDPILAYSAGGEVSQVHWGQAHTNWICIVFNKSLEILRV